MTYLFEPFVGSTLFVRKLLILPKYFRTSTRPDGPGGRGGTHRSVQGQRVMVSPKPRDNIIILTRNTKSKFNYQDQK